MVYLIGEDAHYLSGGYQWQRSLSAFRSKNAGSVLEINGKTIRNEEFYV